jgi:CDP-diacylglycerol--inositol 3-phosphatidyltransferase
MRDLLAGYMRAVLAAVALYYMSHHPKYSTMAYAMSQLLDAADGWAARKLGQASRFGAVLDMVVDRCVIGPGPPVLTLSG